ncbi:L-seryl-tRNA(Sec) selenium transferase [Helicobacter sp. MIT 00-7814]|uniref:L-seryl-tRNA(Sec) selenium transferase n=1 Tax=unclassified Helicobacter TaxID=2593540 RepID=UPI000E1E8ABD|nr:MULTISPECIES: L-seryl-tRNA(Sec) selenium transferase [unclassified Helicobacter]RDU55087.1 L-seryl-tRNA(Sec) selenium transferase [Helicobacter sp. MIT 99-10781]RDU56906.1 L-seryl-tRNA(Sec) selenium transferase [Helicobacter sp. MIT 00-7814]
MHAQELFQALPKMDTLLNHKNFAKANKTLLKPLISKHLQELREEIQNLIESHAQSTLDSHAVAQIQEKIRNIPTTIQNAYNALFTPTLIPVVNASGVVLQTNLGRSVLSQQVAQKLLPLLTRYCTLEYDLDKGARSSRYTHANALFQALFQTDYEFLVVNNNAAAVLLILQTFAKNKKVLISRGELVEIGGGFRIPEVMKQAGCELLEVGATNKTHLSDYENALSAECAMILKAHKSNFSQIGFCAEVAMKDLSALAQREGMIDYYDLGSGYVSGLESLPHAHYTSENSQEPSLKEIFSAPPSLLSFSGDKLFGSAQAGIIAGKKELIERLKKNQLLRALRVDKLCLGVLQASLEAYLQNDFDAIPTLRMLRISPDSLLSRAQQFLKILRPLESAYDFEVKKVDSLSGGGSLPDMKFESYGIAISAKAFSCAQLEERLRRDFSIITRIIADKVLCDMRTLLDNDEMRIFEALESLDSTHHAKNKNAKF